MPFSKEHGDWDGFAGCNSEYPFISTEDITVIRQKSCPWNLTVKRTITYGGILVIDGPVIQIFISQSDWEEDDEKTFTKTLGCPEEAISFALNMSRVNSYEWLTKNFVKIG